MRKMAFFISHLSYIPSSFLNFPNTH